MRRKNSSRSRQWLVAFLVVLLSNSAAAARPNIVLIFSDDQGWRDIGYNSADGFFETPNLDRLASQGMTLTSAYAAAGNCAPSRACLLSGQYTPRHGLYAVGSTKRGPVKRMRLEPTPNAPGLTGDAVTVAETLREAGYATGCFGKWHLGKTDGMLPMEQGFDKGADSWGEGPLPHTQGGGNKKGPPSDPKGVFEITELACRFIEAHRDQSFFCYVSHHAIHTPLQTRPESLVRFKGKVRSRLASPTYAACTYDLDASVGRLLKCLREAGVEDNTLVVFTSDNGATPQSDQSPLRGAKGSYYEGGIRVPMIVRWPGVVAAGSVCDEPVINVDLYPTFAAAAGASAPDGYDLDGRNLVPVLAGSGSLSETAIYWFFPGYLNSPVPRGRAIDVAAGFRTRPVSVVRSGKWKLHLFEEEWVLDGGWERRSENHAVELYDLDADPARASTSSCPRSRR